MADFTPEIKPPVVPKEMAEWLRENYPPKCWDPSKQTEAAHHAYRGMVDLADYLYACYEQGADAQTGLDADAEQANTQGA